MVVFLLEHEKILEVQPCHPAHRDEVGVRPHRPVGSSATSFTNDMY
jgi:hypothetical protein